jgi:hypothetical protein
MIDAGATTGGGVRVVDLSIPVGPDTQIYPNVPFPRSTTPSRSSGTA